MLHSCYALQLNVAVFVVLCFSKLVVYVTCPHRCGCFICYASSSKSTIHVAEMLDSTNDIAQITGVNKKVLNSELSKMSLSFASFTSN